MQGGVGAFTHEVAKAMSQQGHRVSVFTRQEAKKETRDAVDVMPVVGQRWGWGTLRLMKSWALDSRPDIVNIQFQTAAYNMHPAIHFLPDYLRPIPVAVTFHDLRVPYLFPKAGLAREWIVRRLARSTQGVIATDRADEATLRDVWAVANVRWIPIGSNVSANLPPGYNRTAARASLGVKADDLLISYFGFLNESKGALVLVEALARQIEQGIPAHLVMIGGRAGASDPTNFHYGERVDALITSLGLQKRVHWTGFMEDTLVSAAFAASDVAALPYLDGASLRRGTLMAALAHGKAIVTTTPQTVAPELEGVVATVPPGDAVVLADTLCNIWRDARLRSQLERSALEAASLFGWEGIAQRTTEFFEWLLSQ